MPPAASAVWKFFKRNHDQNTVKCSLCSVELKWTGGTSNMRNHLRGVHPTTNTQASTESPKQATMNAFVTPRKLSTSQNEKITQALADMVVHDYLPLSFVEGEGFQNLMNILAPDYKIPSRNTIRSRVEKKYGDEKSVFMNELENVESMSITTDTWTSNATDSYLTVTEHHIDDQWNLQSNVLLTREMPERHTGENLASKLKSCVSEFAISDKIGTVVHDNARNMDCAVAKCPDWDDIGCFGHTLQLCIKPAIEHQNVSKVVSKCRKLVGHFKHSTTLTSEMRKRQSMLNIPQHELIQDVPTRWNSTQMMLERLCEQRRVITDIMLDNTVTKKSDSGLQLSSHEWDVISELSCVLKDLTKVTTYMCTDSAVSSSEIYPIVCGLIKNCLNYKSDDTVIVRRVKETVSGELSKRYRPNDIDIASTTPVLSSLLDPRYKTLPFLNAEQRSVAEETLESRMDEMPLRLATRENIVEAPPAKKARKTLNFLVFETPEQSVEDVELKEYLSEKSVDCDPLVWWGENYKKYPRISKIAKKLLCVPATSVPSERIFSSAGLLVTKLRNRLSSDLVDKIIFLNKNKCHNGNSEEM